MSALFQTLECAPTRKPHDQIHHMGRIAIRDEMVICATINGVFVSVGWGDGSVDAAIAKYDRDYSRLPNARKRFSVVSYAPAVILFLVAFEIVAKGLMA